MRITEVFEQPGLPLSFEVFPPKGELAASQAQGVLAALSELHPSFVSVTCSAGGSGNSSHTLDVALLGKREFDQTMLVHLTCMGATRAAMDATLQALRENDLENVLALRGDPVEGRTLSDYRFAKDLIGQVADAGLCVGAAAYPEGHVECLDFSASLEHLKEKQDAGARFFVTQLFFDNEQGLRFLDAARKAGITVPITFGIMPFLSKEQITRMVFTCGASLPAPVVKLLARWEHDPESLRQAGIQYACGQLEGLADHGVDGLHVYTMNKPDIAQAAAQALASYR